MNARRLESRPGAAPRAAFEVGEADVGGDAVEPGADRRPALEGVVRLPGAQERLLHEVLGLVGRSGHAVAVGEQLPAVGVGHRLEVRRLLALGRLRLVELDRHVLLLTDVSILPRTPGSRNPENSSVPTRIRWTDEFGRAGWSIQAGPRPRRKDPPWAA